MFGHKLMYNHSLIMKYVISCGFLSLLSILLRFVFLLVFLKDTQSVLRVLCSLIFIANLIQYMYSFSDVVH